MKKLNKKGFTIIELVIVIAVIAILAAVMVPTFSSIVDKANKSAVEQETAALYKEVLALDLSDGVIDGEDHGTPVAIDGKDFEYIVDKTKHEVTSFSYNNKTYTAKLTPKDGKYDYTKETSLTKTNTTASNTGEQS